MSVFFLGGGGGWAEAPYTIIHDMHIKMLNTPQLLHPLFSFSTRLLQKSIILWSHLAACSA